MPFMTIWALLRRRADGRDPLAVTMSGVRMGERLLQVGVDREGIAGAIAAKVGISGDAAFVTSDEQEAERARSSAAAAGAAADVHVAPFDALPFGDAAFDAVVVHRVASTLPAAAWSECRRVLREGGRVIVVEPGTRTGLGGLLGGKPERDGSASVSALERGGFRPVRILADREGYRFVEGLRTKG